MGDTIVKIILVFIIVVGVVGGVIFENASGSKKDDKTTNKTEDSI